MSNVLDRWMQRDTYVISSTPSELGDNGVYHVDAAGGNSIVNLPNIATQDGRFFYIKKIDTTTNSVTLTPYSGQTIDGAATLALHYQWDIVMLVSRGGNWYVSDQYNMVANAAARANDSNFTFYNPSASKDYVSVTGKNYVVVATFIFRGTAVWNPAKAYIVCSRSAATGSSYIRVWDASNALQIFEYNYTHTARTLDLYTTFANLPSSASMFEVQLKNGATNDGNVQLHAMGLYPAY